MCRPSPSDDMLKEKLEEGWREGGVTDTYSGYFESGIVLFHNYRRKINRDALNQAYSFHTAIARVTTTPTGVICDEMATVITTEIRLL